MSPLFAHIPAAVWSQSTCTRAHIHKKRDTNAPRCKETFSRGAKATSLRQTWESQWISLACCCSAIYFPTYATSLNDSPPTPPGDSRKASSFTLFQRTFLCHHWFRLPDGSRVYWGAWKAKQAYRQSPFWVCIRAFSRLSFSLPLSVFLSPLPAAGVILSAQCRPLLLSLCIHYRVTLTGFTGKPGESARESQSFVSLCRKLLFV